MRIKNTLYFDHQATTPLDARVLAEMSSYFGAEFGNPHSSDHVIGWKAAEAIEHARTAVAALVGADADEVIFTSGATEANNLAIQGLARRAVKGTRKRILISAIEHKSVLACARMLESSYGYSIEFIPVDETGIVDLDFISNRLDDNVLIVSVMAVNNEIGSIQPCEEIGNLSARHGAIFHCDAAQAACATDISNLSQHADFISLSAHKMYGPAGVGAAILRRSLQDNIEPIIYGGGQESGLRSGTVPLPLAAGMGAATNLLRAADAEEERVRIKDLRDRLITGIASSFPSLVINGPSQMLRHPGNANLRFGSIPAQDLIAVLQPRIAVSTGSACTSGIPEPSHVLRAIGLSAEEAEASVRFSIGRQTTAEDIEEVVKLISEALLNLEGGAFANAV